jgi:hypothetical protein
MVGIGTIPGVIGLGKNFTGHHQVTLAIEGHMVSQVAQDMEDLRESQVDQGHMVNRVDRDMEDLRESQADPDHMVSQVVPAEADLTLKCMDHRAK